MKYITGFGIMLVLMISCLVVLVGIAAVVVVRRDWWSVISVGIALVLTVFQVFLHVGMRSWFK